MSSRLYFHLMKSLVCDIAVSYRSIVPAAKSTPGKAQDNSPVLYIEFRKDQRPVDPDPWWVDASRKVQG